MISQSKANESLKQSETRRKKYNHTSATVVFHSSLGSSKKASISVRDALILKEMLESDGRISSLALSRKTEMPITTVQRHRKRIEGTLIKTIQIPHYSAFGLMEMVVDICTEGGLSGHVLTELRDFPNVVYLSRIHGDSHISLRIRILVRSNKELAHWLDRIKAIDGVREVNWTEIVEEIPHKADLQRLLNLSVISGNHVR